MPRAHQWCSSFRTWVPACVLIMLSLTLTGCGEAGGPTSAPTLPPTVTPAPPATTTHTTTPYDGFSCASDVVISDVSKIANKGICLDDTTFQGCPDKMLGLWPHTKEQVKSVRLFKAWSPAWGDETMRDKAWDALATWVQRNDAQVLIGTGIGCDHGYDAEEWQTVKLLMEKLGPKRVMGVAIGNEMDAAWQWPGMAQACLDELWGHRFFEVMSQRVSDMDSMGFQSTPITSVWSTQAMAAKPFKEDHQAKVATFVRKAYEKWGKRWVWTFNTYAYWDDSLPISTPGSCAQTIALAAGDYNARQVGALRERIKMITGNANDPFWIGETGWSSPRVSSRPDKDKCPDYSSKNTLRKVYSQFLSWDFGLIESDAKKGYQGPDYAFYFDVRDSSNTGAKEYFGLVHDCKATMCKLQKDTDSALVV